MQRTQNLLATNGATFINAVSILLLQFHTISLLFKLKAFYTHLNCVLFIMELETDLTVLIVMETTYIVHHFFSISELWIVMSDLVVYLWKSPKALVFSSENRIL